MTSSSMPRAAGGSWASRPWGSRMPAAAAKSAREGAERRRDAPGQGRPDNMLAFERDLFALERRFFALFRFSFSLERLVFALKRFVFALERLPLAQRKGPGNAQQGVVARGDEIGDLLFVVRRFQCELFRRSTL